MAIDNNIALVTLSDAKNYLKIATDQTSEDEIVGNLANEVSTWASSYVGRKLQYGSYTEYLDGDGTETVMVDNYPIIAVSALYDDPTRAFGGTSQINLTTNAVYTKDSGVIRLLNSCFNVGIGNIKVVYTAGYTQATAPHDLRLAIKKLLAGQYKVGYAAGSVGIKSQSIGDRNLTYIDDAMPKDVMEILNKYRAVHSPSGSFT